MEGYVVAFAVFYERGFSVPSHWFLRSLLQYYGLELHNLTPSVILHIVTFVTLLEAFTGIDPHFDLWNHFLRVRLPTSFASGSHSAGWCGHSCQVWACR
jgi:hypothetical protein